MNDNTFIKTLYLCSMMKYVISFLINRSQFFLTVNYQSITIFMTHNDCLYRLTLKVNRMFSLYNVSTCRHFFIRTNSNYFIIFKQVIWKTWSTLLRYINGTFNVEMGPSSNQDELVFKEDYLSHLGPGYEVTWMQLSTDVI
jgi:hypothetical protein